jgi:hypothetical protein
MPDISCPVQDCRSHCGSSLTTRGRVLPWCAGKPGRRLCSRRRRSLMLATMQRMLGKLAPGRRAPDQAGTIAKLAGRRRRQAWAKSLQQLLDRANRSTSAAQFPHPEWEAPLLLRTKCCAGLSTRVAGNQGRALGHAAAHLGRRRAAAQEVPGRPERFSAVRQPPDHRPTGRQTTAAGLHGKP